MVKMTTPTSGALYPEAADSANAHVYYVLLADDGLAL